MLKELLLTVSSIPQEIAFIAIVTIYGVLMAVFVIFVHKKK